MSWIRLSPLSASARRIFKLDLLSPALPRYTLTTLSPSISHPLVLKFSSGSFDVRVNGRRRFNCRISVRFQSLYEAASLSSKYCFTGSGGFNPTIQGSLFFLPFKPRNLIRSYEHASLVLNSRKSVVWFGPIIQL